MTVHVSNLTLLRSPFVFCCSKNTLMSEPSLLSVMGICRSILPPLSGLTPGRHLAISILILCPPKNKTQAKRPGCFLSLEAPLHQDHGLASIPNKFNSENADALSSTMSFSTTPTFCFRNNTIKARRPTAIRVGC